MKEFVPMTCDFALKEIMDIPLVRKYFVSDVTGIPVEEIKSIRIVNPFLWRRRRNIIPYIGCGMKRDTSSRICSRYIRLN